MNATTRIAMFFMAFLPVRMGGEGLLRRWFPKPESAVNPWDTVDLLTFGAGIVAGIAVVVAAQIWLKAPPTRSPRIAG